MPIQTLSCTCIFLLNFAPKRLERFTCVCVGVCVFSDSAPSCKVSFLGFEDIADIVRNSAHTKEIESYKLRERVCVFLYVFASYVLNYIYV